MSPQGPTGYKEIIEIQLEEYGFDVRLGVQNGKSEPRRTQSGTCGDGDFILRL